MKFGPLAVPASVVTLTITVPVPLGTVAVIWVPLSTENNVALSAPNLTALVPKKPVPVRVTVLPVAPMPGVM